MKRQARKQVRQQSLVYNLRGSEQGTKKFAETYFENRFFCQKRATTKSISEVDFTLSGFAHIKYSKEQLALFTKWFSALTLIQPSEFTFSTNASKPKRAEQKSKLYEVNLKLNCELSRAFLLRWRYFIRKCFLGLSKTETQSYRMSPLSVSSAVRYSGLHQLPVAAAGVASTDPLLQFTIRVADIPENTFGIPSKVLPKALKQVAKERLNCFLSKYKM